VSQEESRGWCPSIGNDLVDLKDPETSLKQIHPRFVERVFERSERSCIMDSEDPHSTLWIHWAAKESAFKAVRKNRPDLVFSHQAFVARFETISRTAATGVVSCEGGPVGVVVTRLGRWLHAVALLKTGRAVKGGQIHGVSRLGIDQEPSRAAREFAVSVLARVLGYPVDHLAITDERPPRLLLEGVLADVDVSLAHHGSGIAFAATISGV
jgi:phosphopantetheinyl transferase (holo-ACP synthase)